MAKNLSDFSRENVFVKQEKPQPKAENKQFKEEDLKSKFDEYSSLPKTDLENKLLEEVSKSKADGSFDEGLLRDSVSKIAPYLANEDKERLLALLDKITCREIR